MASSSIQRIGSEENLPGKSKQFKPSENRVERKKLENLLNETRSILEEERVERLASLSQAEWIPSIQLVKVTKKTGKHWNTMGHTYLGDSVLYPEEALFLLETNAIEISFGGMPMSLQQAYSVLLGENSTCTLEEYRVYSHLTKYGFKLRRHGCEPTIYRREGDEPPEIDVVGIICKRKSSENDSSERTADGENSAKKVKEENPRKWSCELSTSSKNAKLNLPSVDDDDVKFIEFVDASKKRKVCDTIVIGDEVEILSSSTNKESHSLSQSGEPSNSKVTCSESEESEQGTKDGSSDCLETSNGDTPIEESVESSDKPCRGLYKRRPFPSLKKDEEVLNCVPSSNAIGKPTSNISREGNVQNNIPSATEVSKESSNDVIVILSDDESNSNDKHKDQLEVFYQEISLLEVIDISEDDVEKRTTSSDGANNKETDESYDFWGVLGRIPIMRNGKLSISLPAPPSDLIPSNTTPVKDEYTINVKELSGKPVNQKPEESVDRSRVRDGQQGRWKRSLHHHHHHHGGNRGYQHNSSRYQPYPSPYPSPSSHHSSSPHIPLHNYQGVDYQYQHPWSPWNAQYFHGNGLHSSIPSTSSQNNFGRQYPQSSWLSYVYTRRPSHRPFGNFQARNSNSYQSRGPSMSSSQGRDLDKPTEKAADEDEFTSVVPKDPDARCWSEMKRRKVKKERGATNDEEASTNSNEFPPWSNTTQTISPLLKPSDSVDVDAVLSKIQVTTSAKMSCDTSEARTCSLAIKYDLYMPNSTFRKSCPGAPRYRLSVVKSNDSIPKLSDHSYLTKDANDEVPLLFAVGFPENINFFSFSNVDLPVPLKN